MKPSGTRGRPVVIGLGNPERGDDGLGPTVVGLLEASLAGQAELLSAGSDPTGVLDLWDEAPLALLVDAVRAGGAPGEIYRWEVVPGELPLERAWSSTHSLGVREVVGLSWALGRTPHRLILYGAEAGPDRWGWGLSAPVEAAAEEIARRIRQDLRRGAGTADAAPEALHA